MKLIDILSGRPLDRIEVRTNSSFDDDQNGVLFGFCAWDGSNLISLDGDNYYLDEEVTKFEWAGGNLRIWIHSEWK